jgi:FlaA1/EpsC-like NDP-sugar epimerase
MNMPSFYMTDIADVIISEYGNEYTEKVIIGKREGEKIHEVLISTAEAARSFIFNKNYFIIKPELKIDEKTISLYRKDLERVDFTEFSSNTNIKDKNLFESLLRESGF